MTGDSTSIDLDGSRSSAVGDSGGDGDRGDSNSAQADPADLPIGAEENNDWVRKMVDCLTRSGFKAEAFDSSQGMLGFQNTGDTSTQVQAWSDAVERCQSKVGRAPEIPRFTPEQLSHLYDFLVDQADCLTDKGFSIPSPPTRETFVETYYSAVAANEEVWGPYTAVGRLSPTALSDLEADCPPQPTSADLR